MDLTSHSESKGQFTSDQRRLYHWRLCLATILVLSLLNCVSNQQGGVLFPTDSVIPVTNVACTTPDHRTGECVPISSCSLLIQKLVNRPTQADLDFVRRSTCQYQGFTPIVCCPVGVNNMTVTPPLSPVGVPTQAPPSHSPVAKTTPRPLPQLPPLMDSSTQISKQDFEVGCGHSFNPIAVRIVGGEDSQPFQWPWMAAIFIEVNGVKPTNVISCGGALISRDFVVTAGHCTFDRRGPQRPPKAFTVRLGDLDIASSSDGMQPEEFEVAEVIPHPNYDRLRFQNDIALLRLKRKATFTRAIQPICLPGGHNKDNTFVRNTPFVAGWGTTSFNGPASSRLRHVPVSVVTNDVCKKNYENLRQTVITERMLCAGLPEGGKDACQGDSGGPLMLPDVRNNFRYSLIGVVSFGFRCAEPGFPGIYTRVTQYEDWLRRTAGI